MIAFFGIFHPGELARRASVEAPAKANFFGGGDSDARPTALEDDNAWLSGKAPDPQNDDRPRLQEHTFSSDLTRFLPF
ncbi:MAG: hypothetical protein IR164_06620 [Devosia sp.]|jgi:hypothetical protein|uniref:hypothetical protein n=1 Tax=unclassified Devosia TaxID=196773 RepID=UPI0019F88E1C|nr:MULTISPECIES: hypothetical protein [unclassified Devosia]MBF0678593.1 hypothetical protein [Devosia sp.]WEJ31836.1 hypothetical protein NYQ88_13070 [Devosia sp. SD17-2]